MANNLLSLREREIFATLERLKDYEFVVIGGYAVNAYALPRFSVDCDIVIEDKKTLDGIEAVLSDSGYHKIDIKSTDAFPFHGKFVRYEKEIQKNFKVSLDVMVGQMLDRLSGASFSYKWIFENSKKRPLRGKTVVEYLDLVIPEPGTLITMKLASCRETDIRDIFMMITQINDRRQLKKSILAAKIDFQKNFKRIKNLVTSKDFKKNLEGVYGYVDEKVFEKHKKLLLELERYQ